MPSNMFPVDDYIELGLGEIDIAEQEWQAPNGDPLNADHVIEQVLQELEG